MIYLDFAATTPVDPRVLEVMLPYFSVDFGNSSSIHHFGQKAEAALEAARESIAADLHCAPGEIVFTSCGSESDNLALRGIALALRQKTGANHILISSVEHHAVSRTASQLHNIFNFEVELIPVNSSGTVEPEEVISRLRPDTSIVSIIYGNNEIGTINPIAEIGAICHKHSVYFHTDAVQAAAYLPVHVDELNVDLLSIGAHKFYGPKGIGALFIKNGVPILPIQTGGSQEKSRRAGTHNIPFIVGLAESLRLAQVEREKRTSHVLPLRDWLVGNILEQVPDAKLSGHHENRLPNHASFVFNGVDGNSLITQLDMKGFACSSGSACKTGDPEPSDVLLACGFDRNWALGSLRITLGNTTNSDHVEQLVQVLPELIQRNRKLAMIK